MNWGFNFGISTHTGWAERVTGFSITVFGYELDVNLWNWRRKQSER